MPPSDSIQNLTQKWGGGGGVGGDHQVDDPPNQGLTPPQKQKLPNQTEINRAEECQHSCAHKDKATDRHSDKVTQTNNSFRYVVRCVNTVSY